MMSRDQLLVQEEYEEIVQDVKDSVSKYGKIVSMHAPQPKESQMDCAGMGHVFVEYSAISSAQYARRVGSGHGSGAHEETVQQEARGVLLLRGEQVPPENIRFELWVSEVNGSRGQGLN